MGRRNPGGWLRERCGRVMSKALRRISVTRLVSAAVAALLATAATTAVHAETAKTQPGVGFTPRDAFTPDANQWAGQSARKSMQWDASKGRWGLKFRHGAVRHTRYGRQGRGPGGRLLQGHPLVACRRRSRPRRLAKSGERSGPAAAGSPGPTRDDLQVLAGPCRPHVNISTPAHPAAPAPRSRRAFFVLTPPKA